MGGLGNQMFQIATTYALYKDLKSEFPVEYKKLEFGFDFDNCFTPLQGHTSIKYKDSFFGNFKNIESPTKNSYYEKVFSYTKIPILPSYKDGLTINGYFQSEKYFKNYKNEIVELFDKFDLSKKALVMNFLMNLNYNSLTSVHVRRGDYISPPYKQEFHTNLGKTDYYKNAMEIIGNEGAFIFVSDDIEWCKENFKGDNIFYSPFNEELDDLLLMSMCDNQIIANSSFSWWGAWLNENENKKVIAPKNWFAHRGPQDAQDLVPENWMKI